MFCFKNNNRTFTILTIILVILLVFTGFIMNKNYHKHVNNKSGPTQSEKTWHSVWKFGCFGLAILAIILMFMAVSVLCDGDFWCLWFITDGLGDLAGTLLDVAGTVS